MRQAARALAGDLVRDADNFFCFMMERTLLLLAAHLSTLTHHVGRYGQSTLLPGEVGSRAQGIRAEENLLQGN